MDYFYQPGISSGLQHLSVDESKHCIRVLRKNSGDKILVLDGYGGIYSCQITNPDPKKTGIKILEKNIPFKPQHFIHIAISPTKNTDRLEWFLEKSSEIGVQRISFLLCHHSERRKLNMDRVHKKLVSAMKQSGNPYLPVMDGLIPLETFLIDAGTQSIPEKYICHKALGRENHLIDLAGENSSYLILIGPEGDFSEDELDKALDSGFKPVSLGRSRLRTETAGMVAVTLLNALNSKH